MPAFFDEDGDGLFEISVGAIGEGTVGLPDGMSVGRGNDQIGIIRRREVDDFLPVRFVGIDRDEVSEFLGGDVFAHTVNDHGPDQRGRALEDRHSEVGYTGVGVVVGGDFSAPDLAQVATLMREAEPG